MWVGVQASAILFDFCITEILRELVSKSNIERQAQRWMGLTSLQGWLSALRGPVEFSVTNK